MFNYSNSNKRFHTLDYHLKSKFGCKIAKIPLDAGFTCPNIDGRKGYGGCIYCSPNRSSDFCANNSLQLAGQFEEQKARLSKWKTDKYIAYFQAHTNTYAPLEQLKSIYETALSLDGVVGLSIATRADCISDEIADLLEELSARTYLTVELGLQTIFDKTAEYINRCHTFLEFMDGFNKLKSRKIRLCIHLINGLPDETAEMMLASAKKVGEIGADAVKFHMLNILKGTRIEDEYLSGKISLLNRDEYVEIICRQIELLPPETVIERLTGDGDKAILTAPQWITDKRAVLNAIDIRLKALHTYQGSKLYSE